MKNKKIHYLTMICMLVVGNVLVAVLVISVILGAIYYRYMRSDVMNRMRSNVEQTENYISLYVENISNTAEKLAMDVELGIAVERYTGPDIGQSVEGKKMIDYILQNALSMNSAIENIAIGTKDRVIMQSRYDIDKDNHMDECTGADWYKELQQDKIGYKITENTYYSNTYTHDNYYLYATKFKNKFYQTRAQEDRIVIITFNTAELEKYISSIVNNEAININIIESGQKLIYQSLTDGEIAEYLLGNMQEAQRKRVEGDYVFFEKQSPLIGWNIIGNVSKKTLYELIYKVDPWMILLVLLVIGVSASVSFFSSRMVSRPIKKLSQAMTDIENSQFHEVEADTHCVEIDQLLFTYNRMYRTIEELIDNIKLREEEKRKIEFKVLEAQINPHFIYNTLDAVKWVACINHSDKIANIIESFVHLLRLSLSEGREIISVEEEILLIREYTKIMIFRNNYDIDIRYDIASETRMCGTLKLVLQPFVENSFLHAFGQEKRERHIDIISRCEGDALIFSVADNGSGFLLQDREDKQMTGIGIDNTDKRIKAWYGEKYGVEIRSERDRGTVVTVRQPIININESANAELS